MKHTKPLWVMLENVDLGDVTEGGSNAAMVHHALDDAGYTDRSFYDKLVVTYTCKCLYVWDCVIHHDRLTCKCSI